MLRYMVSNPSRCAAVAAMSSTAADAAASARYDGWVWDPTIPASSTRRSGAKSPATGVEVANRRIAAAIHAVIHTRAGLNLSPDTKNDRNGTSASAAATRP